MHVWIIERKINGKVYPLSTPYDTRSEARIYKARFQKLSSGKFKVRKYEAVPGKKPLNCANCGNNEVGFMSALDKQIGGNHYKAMEIQPVEFITKNKIGFLPGCIIKRACRFDKPGGKGLEDLEKIKHEAELLIEFHKKQK